ncbi:MAG: ribosomal-processing cysteine protease Prp [Clostridia bacterium]|nr:ribosomal-processing cysteine protease Prp [Clostridia bacterium]MCR5693856.1 ribosomal-processing cysteine protease Prp [Clostridia bacterium]
MVEVRIHRAPDGLVERFEAKGHAGYAKAGKDIVCSAATAVMFTAVGYAESLYNPENLPEKVCYRENDGFLEWKCPEISAEDRQKLIPVFDAMVLGLRQIRASVGNRYLVVYE